MSSIGKVLNRFAYWSNSDIPQEIEKNTYICAYGWTKLQGAKNGGYISSDYANRIFAALPTSSFIRGVYYLEEDSRFLFLLIKEGDVSELGYLDEKQMIYKPIVDDTKTDIPIGLKKDVWTNMAVNVYGSCNIKDVTFSTNKVYRSIRINDPCCDFSDTTLFNPTCMGVFSGYKVKGLGNLVGGSYSATIRLGDDQNNWTNYTSFNEPISIADDDNVSGQETRYGIVYEIDNLPEGYNLAEIVIAQKINGDTKYRVIDASYGGSTLKFTYTGTEGTSSPSILENVLTRIEHYYYGDGLAEFKDRLLLFNTEPDFNYDLQRDVNEWDVGYGRWIVPADKADLFHTLKANEKYIIGVKFKLKDGRFTNTFEFINKNKRGTEEGTAPFFDCPIPEYMFKDTSERTSLFITDAKDISAAFADQQTDSNNNKLEFTANINPDAVVSKSGLVETRSEGGDPEDGDAGFDYCECSDPPEDSGSTSFVKKLQSSIWGLLGSLLRVFGGPSTSFPTAQKGCDSIDCVYKQVKPNIETSLDNLEAGTLATANQEKNVITGTPCDIPGEIKCVDQICHECINGFWHYKNNVVRYENSREYKRTGVNNRSIPGGREYDDNNANGFSPEGPEYGPDCSKKFQPIKYSEGTFGYWETENTYPDILSKVDCAPMYGEYAGTPQRLFVVPSLSKEPHFISLKDGFPNQHDQSNDLIDDTYAIVTGVILNNIKIPPILEGRLCEDAPFELTYAHRTESEKTVLSMNHMISCFKGSVQGEDLLFAKHGASSFEFYDGYINPGGNNTLRRGSSSDVPAYVLHGPDVHLFRNHTQGQYMLIEQEVYGTGVRFGHYAEGKPVSRWSEQKRNQAGTRIGLNLNHYKDPSGSSGNQPLFRPIRALKFAGSDQIIPRGDDFTYSLSNKHRESSVYVELEGDVIPFTQPAGGVYGSTDSGDGASDSSFIGDTIDHFSLINNARALTGTVMRFLPNQYGASYNRKYISLGVVANSNTFSEGRIAGICGDSYVGSFTIKRTALVSDKVPEDITPTFNVTGGNVISFVDALPFNFILFRYLPILADEIASVINKIFRGLFNVLGLENCGTVPIDGDETDPRNIDGGLRKGMRALTGDSGGIGPPSPDPNPDTYMPMVLKTAYHSIFVSDANMKYRQAGAVSIGEDGIAEVHYDNLKSLKFDSAFPEGTYWPVAWMNRFYVEMLEPSRWKVLFKISIGLIWTYGIPLALFLWGLFLVVTSIAALVIGVFVTAVGSAIAATFGFFLIHISIFWVRLWMNLDIDDKIINKILGIEWCRPDKKMPRGPGADFAMKQGRAVNLEDNYYRYSIDHSSVNDYEVSFGIPVDYDTELCPLAYDTVVKVSNPQDNLSHISNWKRFKPNSLFKIDAGRGSISNIVNMKDSLIVHTESTMYSVRFGESRMQLNNEEILLGTTRDFGRPIDIFGGVIEGYGGLQDPNSAVMLPSGYFWIDEAARRPYLFSGGVQELNIDDLAEWFDENLFFKALQYKSFTRDQKNPSGVYFDIGVDYGRNRLFIYKKDYDIPGAKWNGSFWIDSDSKKIDVSNIDNYVDNNFFIEYDLMTRRFLGSQYIEPEIMFNNRFNMYSVSKCQVWKHDDRTRFNNYYGVSHPLIIDIPIQVDNHVSASLGQINIIGEIIEHVNGTKRELDGPMFDMYMVYTGKQSTGWIPLTDLPINNDIDGLVGTEYYDEGPFKQHSNGITLMHFPNMVKDNTPLSRYNRKLKIWESEIIEGQMHEEDRIIDDTMILRLVKFPVKGKENIQLHLRKVITNTSEEY
jgi:hypothetical protein